MASSPLSEEAHNLFIRLSVDSLVSVGLESGCFVTLGCTEDEGSGIEPFGIGVDVPTSTREDGKSIGPGVVWRGTRHEIWRQLHHQKIVLRIQERLPPYLEAEGLPSHEELHATPQKSFGIHPWCLDCGEPGAAPTPESRTSGTCFT